MSTHAKQEQSGLPETIELVIDQRVEALLKERLETLVKERVAQALKRDPARRAEQPCSWVLPLGRTRPSLFSGLHGFLRRAARQTETTKAVEN